MQYAVHFIECDHSLCGVTVEGVTSNDVVMEAQDQGWASALVGRHHGRKHFCPEHTHVVTPAGQQRWDRRG